jgi:glycosyltransferase involved in cell wall biosynthesis
MGSGSRPGAAKPVRVVVDGAVFGFQRHGGINTYFREILRRAAARPGLAVDLLVPPGVVGRLPGGRVRRLRAELLPATLSPHAGWKANAVYNYLRPRAHDLVRSLRLRLPRRAVFQSTYFTLPGCDVPQVAMALDLNHELMPEYYVCEGTRGLPALIRRSILAATRVVAISETTRKHVCQVYRVPESTVDVVYPAVERAVYYPERDAGRIRAARERYGLRRPYLLFVGLRGLYKNFDALVRAFFLGGHDRRHDLVAAGSPWTEEEAARLAGLPRAGAVVNVPWPSPGELRALYTGASAFVFPSRGEGFGIPLLEAMACETPVAASDIEIFHEVAGDAAVFFDPAAPEDIARQLHAALDPTARPGLIARGRERARDFTWDAAAEKMCEVYQKVA